MAVQNGVTVNATGNYAIYVSGTFLCNGTSSSPNTFTTSTPNPVLGVGYWGGIQCDSASKVYYMFNGHILTGLVEKTL